MTGARAPGRPRDERASRAIAEAALRQLSEVGYANVSMESVAAEAGVARATVYRRYRDKADLVTSAIASAGPGGPGGTSSTAGPGGDPSGDPRRDLIRLLVQLDARFAEPCLEVVGALLGAREQPHAMALHRQRVVSPRLSQARSLLARARELGQIGPGADLDLALHMLVGVVFARRIAGIPSDPGWAEEAVSIIWRGLGSG